MPSISGADRQARLDRIQLIVKQSNGISETEVAEQFKNVDRKTINTYLRELRDEGVLYKEGKLWLYDESFRSIVLRPLALRTEEAMTLYLATRLLVNHTDRRNEIASTVLTKLAGVLHNDAGVHRSILESAKELAQKPEEDNFQDVYRLMMRATLQRTAVVINYRPYRSGSFTTTIHPYLIEPSGLGFATYIIAHNVDLNVLRTYKLERIHHVKIMSGQSFDIPTDFPGLEILQNAWSIFHGDETIEVALRFHPDVVQRVLETNWHSSMELIEDGRHIIMTLQVADITDLKPWIRGWGATCEVLEPQELREEMEGEARALAKLYGVGTDSNSRFRNIFGD